MKRALLIIACLLLVISILIGAREYKQQTGQGCHSGDISNFNERESDTTERATWVWQWWPHRNGHSFIACVGPRSYMVYRPLDIAGLGILLSASLVFVAAKRTGEA